MFNRIFIFCLVLFVAAPAAFAGKGPEPEYIFNETVFESVDGRVIAPRAKHLPEETRPAPEGMKAGWRPAKDGDYIGFDAGEVFFRDKGALEIKLVVMDAAGLIALGRSLEALVTLYDGAGTPFFAVGINGHDLMVGSYPLHPMIMEDAFGGVGFPYLAKLDGPLKDGTEITVKVTWGQDPKDDKVYVNGRYIEVAVRKGPRHNGNPPGYEPTKTLGSFLGGFTTFNGRTVGPPKTLTIGRMGVPDSNDPLSMRTPRSVAIMKIQMSNMLK